MQGSQALSITRAECRFTMHFAGAPASPANVAVPSSAACLGKACQFLQRREVRDGTPRTRRVQSFGTESQHACSQEPLHGIDDVVEMAHPYARVLVAPRLPERLVPRSVSPMHREVTSAAWVEVPGH